MKVLCGTDIIEISRIQKSIEKSGQRFLEIVYTPAEIEYCEGKKKAKYCHYAGRFAAKEAIYKAVSSLLKDKFAITWQNAQVINDENGNPKVEFIDTEIPEIKNIDISISHCKEYAVATVVITLRNE
ncbi:MAG: holo-ACP synthase [Clostridia bacterium]